MLTRQLSNSRKKIDRTELGKRRSNDGGGKNSGSTVLQNGSSWCGRGFDEETMATSPNSSQRFFESDGAVQMITFQPTSHVSKHEESCYQLISSCSTNRSNAVKSGAEVNTERLPHFPARRASFDTSSPGLSLLEMPDSKLTRHRSSLDSQAEDTTRMTDEQRNKLERLKQQIFLDNTDRKWGRKLSESKVAKSTRIDVTEETKLPVLTGEAMKRHLRCHETPITVSKPLPMYNSSSNFEPTERGTTLANQNYDMDAVFKLTRHESASNQFDAPLNMDPYTSAYYENHSQRKSNEHDFELSPPPLGEEGDFESIAVFMGRLRTRSEPGDMESRKVSTTHQLHTRTRSENNELRTKVQLFVKKPLPALPPSTLRVKKQVINEVTGHSNSGAHADASRAPRERREGIVNIHTCPNLNVFSDRSWVYQDVSRNRHRYIRGPATPVPPVDFVFRKDNSQRP